MNYGEYVLDIANCVSYQTATSSCGGITYEPSTTMWTLRSSTTGTANTGYYSMLKECVEYNYDQGLGADICC